MLKDSLPLEASEAKEIFLNECQGAMAWLSNNSRLNDITGAVDSIVEAAKKIFTDEKLEEVRNYV